MNQIRSNILMMDVGGTSIKRYGLPAVPVKSQGTRSEIAAALKSAVGDTSGLEGIGIAIPGPFNYNDGIFLMDHKYGAVKGESFRTLAGIPQGVELRFIHDVCAVLEGAVEMLGLTSGNSAVVTLGTGLGFAIAHDGIVRYGPSLSPADGIWNHSWKGGILEDKVSARGVRGYYTAMGGDPEYSARDIAESAYHGDQAALDAFDRMGETLGTAIAGILLEHNVSTVLFGGQISRSLDLMEDGLRRSLGPWPTIVRAPEDAVYHGIAKLFKQ